mgnify:CR=1 FL=1
MPRLKPLLFGLFALVFFTNCSSYEQFRHMSEELEIPSDVFRADYDQSWQAVLQVMNKYDLSMVDQEAGVIRTRWRDNTMEVNFADSFGSSDSVKGAKFKLVVNVVKGFRGNREVSKVTVDKRQMIEQDFLQGWKVVRSDGILEKTLLYRIGRVLSIDERLKRIEEKQAEEIKENF